MTVTPVDGRRENDDMVHLYRQAATLESELRSSALTDDLMTATQIGAFNRLVLGARELLPTSVALKQDIGTIDNGAARAADIHRAVNVTLLPTLHNAMPEVEYASV
jgi:hypothetical protein